MTNSKGGMAEVLARLQRVEDALAIMRTLSDYGHGADYGTAERRNDCFAPGRTGIARFKGVADEAKMAAGKARPWAPPPVPDVKHMVSNPVVTSVNGNDATVESYWVYILEGEGNPHIQSFGRYRDKMKKGADGKWRILHRETDIEARSKARQQSGFVPH